MTPEINEQDETPEIRKKISLTSQENLTLIVADPDSAEVKAVMDAHGFEFGDQVEVEVDGVKMVVSTRKEDFWTVNRQATQELKRRDNNVEQEANVERDQLVQEVAEPMGETAVDEMEVEAGLPTDPFGEGSEPNEADERHQSNETEVLGRMKAMFESRVDYVVEDARQSVTNSLRRIGDTAQEIDTALLSMRNLEEGVNTFRNTVMRIEYGDYNTEMGRRSIEYVINSLHPALSQLSRIANSDEIAQGLGMVERTLAEAKRELEDQDAIVSSAVEAHRANQSGDNSPEDVTISSTADIRSAYDSIIGLKGSLEISARQLKAETQSTASTLQRIIGQLDEQIRQSYSTGLNGEILHGILQQLLAVSTDHLRPISPQTEEYVEGVKRVLRSVDSTRGLEV